VASAECADVLPRGAFEPDMAATLIAEEARAHEDVEVLRRDGWWAVRATEVRYLRRPFNASHQPGFGVGAMVFDWKALWDGAEEM
jgi:hypothetical protein